MITLLSSQRESDDLFRRWVNILLGAGTEISIGRVIEGTGVVFTNYGHGALGVIENEVAFGVDRDGKNHAVKIVAPDVAQQDKGKLTAIGVDEQGRHVLLRQGVLQKNQLSDRISDNFEALTGLSPVAVLAAGQVSKRKWYVVADLAESEAAIVAATASFANACARARIGDAREVPFSEELAGYTLGMDEKGRTKKVTLTGGSKEIVDLQGYVWERLREIVGEHLIKPSKHG